MRKLYAGMIPRGPFYATGNREYSPNLNTAIDCKVLHWALGDAVPMIPERPIQKEKKSLAISAVGSAGCRDVVRSLSFLHSTGGIRELLASVALSKNFMELRKVTEVADNLRQGWRVFVGYV